MNPSFKSDVKFDHEKLDVYRCELEFIEWVTPLLDEAVALAKGRTREVCDQLDRASLSALLNTAEGNGKRQRPVRAKFFDNARGLATECAACLDALVAKKFLRLKELKLENICC
jgi:four helix bundle protein